VPGPEFFIFNIWLEGLDPVSEVVNDTSNLSSQITGSVRESISGVVGVFFQLMEIIDKIANIINKFNLTLFLANIFGFLYLLVILTLYNWGISNIIYRINNSQRYRFICASNYSKN